MIFQYLPEKLQQFMDYRELLRIAQATGEKFWMSFKLKKNSLFCLFALYDAAKAAKKFLPKLTKRSEIKQFCKHGP